MPSLNKVLLMGNLTRDPELRVTPKGTPICQFSLAINRQFKMESGESREEVIYVDVEAWGKQGETIAKYMTKGRPLYVEGRLSTRSWEDQVGVKKVIAEVKGEVTAVENVGRKDFVRVTDKKLTSAAYVHVNFSGPADAPANLREKLRLNGSVYRTFIQSA